MSTIEQAAKRLQQLRTAGVALESHTAGQDGNTAPTNSDSVPLRVAMELDARGHPLAGVVASDANAAVVPESGRSVGIADETTPASKCVEIDIDRLSGDGYIRPNSPRSRIAEEFRVIKRPLLNNIKGNAAGSVQNANRIMVTSALPGEGKTFVSVNLALSLAMELDTRVLLVDADAARPAVLQRLGLPPSKGLLDVLVDPSLDLTSVLLRTNVDRLTILPAGTPQLHSTELLASEGMSRLVRRLASDDPQRIVIFDTPPLLVTTESRVLAAHMGQVILVIAADATPQRTVGDALATVENCPVVMTLLNRITQSDAGGYYGSYGLYGY